MRSVLSCVLSICIVFSSVTPSFANAGRTVARFIGAGETKIATQAGQQIFRSTISNTVGRMGAGAGTSFLNTAGVTAADFFSHSTIDFSSPTFFSPDFSRTIQQALTPQIMSSASGLRGLVQAGQIEGLARRILDNSNVLVRSMQLRNEFIPVALQGGAEASELAQALSFYRADLSITAEAFAKLPQGDLANTLALLSQGQAAERVVLLECQDALSDAGALALLGTKADAPVLLDFYAKAKGSVFEETAAVITARGLLRQGAYEEFNGFVAELEPKGSFWTDLAVVATEKNLPIEPIKVVESAAVPVPLELASFLKTGSALNSLNADLSREATEAWLALGTDAAPVQTFAVSPANAVSASTTLPANIGIPSVSLSNVNLFANMQAAPLGETLPRVETVEAASAPSQASIVTKSAPSTVQFFARNEVASTGTSGRLYGGIPVPAMWSAAKTAVSKLYNRLRGKKSAVPTASSKAATHGGFKLTLVNGQGVEHVLPVELSIDARLKTKGYDRVAFTEHANFKHGYVASLRNNGKAPLQMAHFHMRLQSNQVGALIDLVKASGLENFKLKLERKPDVSYKRVETPVFDAFTGEKLPLIVELPAKSFPKDSKLVLMGDGSLGILRKGATQAESLSGFYVRLPKNQIANFVEILGLSHKHFNISIHPTQNRAKLVISKVSLANVSLGKTMGPVVDGALGINVNTSNSMMFTINYILPGLASLLTPVLKKYGEKNLMLLSMGMSTGAGVLATLGGFYGFVEGMTLTPLSKGLFITALFLMSGSSILKQLVSNMLIRANRGEVVFEATKGATKKSAAAAKMPVVEKQGFALLKQRALDLFTKRPDKNLKDIVLYNLSFIYKNVGTLAFLASPYMINYGVKLTTGIDLGLDYSVSFPLYALYSGAVTWKVYRSRLRDAYSKKNLEESQTALRNLLSTETNELAAFQGPISSTRIDDTARAFKDGLDAFAFANIKVDPTQKKSTLYNDTKVELLAGLRKGLTEQVGAPRAGEIVAQVESSLGVQENTLGNMFKMMKAPGVFSLASAMTLATVHEFVISSSFAGTMKNLIAQGELANFLTALSLYVPLIAGRVGGNLISGRISSESMYILCSGLSALGTGIMALAGDSVGMMVTGAAVASLGVGNFFTQMYDYIMRRYPKQNRELSSILALTMALGGLGAIPAGYLAARTGMDAASLWYAGGALVGSLFLTPGMMSGSSLIRGIKYEAKTLWQGAKNLFKRGGGKNNNPPPADLGAAAPAN